jgi:hypothetical protein
MEEICFIRFSKDNRIKLTDLLSKPMIKTSILITGFLTGIAVAYFSSFIPAIWLSVFPNSGKPQLRVGNVLSNHDTSVILRVSQRLVPPNPGKNII